MKPSNNIVLLSCLVTLVFASCTKPVAVQPSPDADTATLRILAQSTGHTVLSQQRTVTFGDTSGSDSVLLNGIIVPDERRTNRISARVGGRIEKLYVRYPYQYVHKGEKLLDLYSPEMNAAIGEYIFLWTKDSNAVLTRQSYTRLTLLGLSDAQLKQYRITGTPASITIYSPYEGYAIPQEPEVMENSNQTQNAPGGMSNMNGATTTAENATSSQVLLEGAYITAGQSLYSINDAKEVIARISVPQGADRFTEPGTPVKVYSETQPGVGINSVVQLVEPVFRNQQHFLSVRISLANPSGLLEYNSLVSVAIHPAAGSHALPSSCVLDLGKRKIVWVEMQKIGATSVVIPRVVVTGYEDKGRVAIISGLNPGEKVALDAGLLVDREGIIKTDLP